MENNDLYGLAEKVCEQLKSDYGQVKLAAWAERSKQTVNQNWGVIPLDHVATIAEKTGMTKLQIRPDREDLFGD